MHITIMRNRRICISNTSKEFACYSLTTHIFSLRSTHIFWYTQLLLGFHHFRYFSRFSIVGNNISKVVPSKRNFFPTISYFYLFIFICILVFEIITVLDITNCIRYYKQVFHFGYSMYSWSIFSLQVHVFVLRTICCLVINVNFITELLSLRIFLSLTDLINFFLIKYLCTYIK